MGQPIRHLSSLTGYGILRDAIAAMKSNVPATVETPVARATPASAIALPAYLALAAGILCIAWSAIFVRWTDIPGPASAFYRMLVPALVLLPTRFFDRDRTHVDGRTLAIIALSIWPSTTPPF